EPDRTEPGQQPAGGGPGGAARPPLAPAAGVVQPPGQPRRRRNRRQARPPTGYGGVRGRGLAPLLAPAARGFGPPRSSRGPSRERREPRTKQLPFPRGSRPMKPLLAFSFLLLAPLLAPGQPPPIDPAGSPGPLVIVGGGKVPDEARKAF